jgi:hypothetical protein
LPLKLLDGKEIGAGALQCGNAKSTRKLTRTAAINALLTRDCGQSVGTAANDSAASVV